MIYVLVNSSFWLKSSEEVIISYYVIIMLHGCLHVKDDIMFELKIWGQGFWRESISISSYVMRCAIWYHLSNLKNVKNSHGGVLLLVNNFTKSNNPPWVFSTFFKLFKWYQIAQRSASHHISYFYLVLASS